MNGHQIRHIAQVFNVAAFAEFGVLGYAGLKVEPMDWLAIGASAAVFLLGQALAVYLLGFVAEEMP
jgi:hypothetical protein